MGNYLSVIDRAPVLIILYICVGESVCSVLRSTGFDLRESDVVIKNAAGGVQMTGSFRRKKSNSCLEFLC